jgi:RNA polymerase sigma-70 factor (ECF subfamily)
MTQSDPDLPLLNDLALGQPDAVRRLVATKLPRLLALAMRLLGDRMEAEDVAQETFFRVWKVAPTWKSGTARFDTWMHTVALNLCRDRLRRRGRLQFGLTPDREDPAPSAEVVLQNGQQADAVAGALGKLPERQREALILQYYQDLPNLDAAQAMGISTRALESLLSRGRRRLRELLSE